jgi:hypothetical protein
MISFGMIQIEFIIALVGKVKSHVDLTGLDVLLIVEISRLDVCETNVVPDEAMRCAERNRVASPQSQK